jgi:hypothetical protein
LLECRAGSRLSQSVRQRARPLIADLVRRKVKSLVRREGLQLLNSLCDLEKIGDLPI